MTAVHKWRRTPRSTSFLTAAPRTLPTDRSRTA
ncbi:hypothetical protein M2271_003863 [Streptomyces sp. LBL]|nr:hypothetical protein [Streptomyces sp. LBL]